MDNANEEKTNVNEEVKEQEQKVVTEEKPQKTPVVEEKQEEKKPEIPEEVKKAMEKVEKSKNEQSEEKPSTSPKLFTKGEDKVKVEIDVLFNKDDGEILSVVMADIGLDLETIEQVLGHQRLWFEFTQPTYDKLNRYRQRSVKYDSAARANVINNLAMRDFFIIYHLKEWNVQDGDGNKIQLEFDKNGAMTDESLDKVYELHPSIIDIAMTAFERKVLLVGM